MKTALKILLLFIIFSGFTSILIFQFKLPTQKERKSSIIFEIHKNEELFFMGEIDKAMMIVDNLIKGAIIPHHDLAGRYISGFFTALAGQRVDTIILIGPDHKVTKNRQAVVADAGWKTQFGIVGAATDIVGELINSEEFITDNEFIADEHSITVTLPYIAKYFPGAKVVPVVVNEYKLEQIEKLADKLAVYVDANTVVMAAVDFSHFLTVEETLQKDKETVEAIKSRDHQKLLMMGNDHLDSPTSIVLLDLLMQKTSASGINVLVVSNSYDLTGRVDQVTSYVVAVY
jgi:MEMO1 family protein